MQDVDGKVMEAADEAVQEIWSRNKGESEAVFGLVARLHDPRSSSRKVFKGTLLAINSGEEAMLDELQSEEGGEVSMKEWCVFCRLGLDRREVESRTRALPTQGGRTPPEGGEAWLTALLQSIRSGVTVLARLQAAEESQKEMSSRSPASFFSGWEDAKAEAEAVFYLVARLHDPECETIAKKALHLVYNGEEFAFTALDADGDGAVSLVEWNAFLTKAAREKGARWLREILGTLRANIEINSRVKAANAERANAIGEAANAAVALAATESTEEENSKRNAAGVAEAKAAEMKAALLRKEAEEEEEMVAAMEQVSRLSGSNSRNGHFGPIPQVNHLDKKARDTKVAKASRLQKEAMEKEKRAKEDEARAMASEAARSTSVQQMEQEAYQYSKDGAESAPKDVKGPHGQEERVDHDTRLQRATAGASSLADLSEEMDASRGLAFLRNFFAAADADGSGALDRRELSEVVQQFYRLEKTSRPKKPVQEEVDKALVSFDINGDGRLQFEEFVDMFAHSKAFRFSTSKKLRAEIKAELWNSKGKKGEACMLKYYGDEEQDAAIVGLTGKLRGLEREMEALREERDNCKGALVRRKGFEAKVAKLEEIYQATLTRRQLYENMMHLEDPSKQKGIFAVNVESRLAFQTCLKGFPKVLLFCLQEEEHRPLVKRVYDEFKDTLVLGSVASSEVELLNQYAVFGPGILVLPDDSSPIRYSEEIDQVDALVEFLRHFSFRPGVVTRLDDFSMDYYIGHRAPLSGPLTMLFTEWNEIPPLYVELAKENPSFLFTITKHTEVDIVAKYGILRFPQLIFIPDPEKEDRIFYEGAITDDKIRTWLRQFRIDLESIVEVNMTTIDLYLAKEPNTPKVLLFTTLKETPKLYMDLFRRFYYLSFAIVHDSTPAEEDSKKLKARFGVEKLPCLFKIVDAMSAPVAYPKHATLEPSSICKFLLEDFVDAPASRANPRGFVGFKREYAWHAQRAL